MKVMERITIMMKFCKKKLKRYKDVLRENLTMSLKQCEIKSYTDLLRITSDSLNIKIFNNDIIEFPHYEHVMLIAHYGAEPEDYIITYIYDYHSSGDSLLQTALQKDEEEKIEDLMKQCEILLDHMITPYVNDIHEFRNKNMKYI